MPTNTSGGTTTSFTNTPQAQGDTFSFSWLTEDWLGVYNFDVMANDLGGAAKTLWSVDDGTNSTSSTLAGADLLSQDTVRAEALSTDTSKNGAKIWITSDGKVGYDSTTLSTGFKASLQALAAGETLSDTFIYAIRLSNGTLSWTTVTVVYQGTNDAPVVSGAVTGSATEDGAVVVLDALKNASDVDHNTTLHVVNVPATLPPGVTYDATSHTFSLDPSVAAYQHLADGQTTTVTVNFGVSDGTATTGGSVTWTITGTNDAPVAHADTGAGSENQVLTIDVLANDTDVDDGHALSLVSAAAPSGKGTASVVGGQLQFDPGTAFDHLADGVTETVVLSYTMKDEHGATSTSTVTITVTGTNDAPVAQADFAGGTENQVLTVDVLSNDSDVDDGHVFTLTGASVPSGQGSVAVDANKVVFDPGTAFDHLAVGATATVVVNYTMQDEHGATSASTLTITVTGTNDAPVAQADTGAGSENQVLTIDVLANDSDVDDGHMLSLVSAAAPSGKGTASIVGGQVQFDPGTAFDHLAEGATETVVLSYTMQDEYGATSTSSVTITVTGTNDAAVITGDVAGSVTEASGVLNGTAGVPTVTGDLNATDVDSSADFVVQTAVAESYGSFSIDATGAWSYTVDDSNSAVQALNTGDTLVETVTVATADGTEQQVQITIHGANDAAVIGTPTVHDVTEDTNVTGGNLVATGSISISDADQNQSSFQTTVTGTAGNLGSLTLQSNGSYNYSVANSAVQYLGASDTKVDTFTVTAADGTTKQVSFTIHGANDAAVIGTPTVHDVTEDTNVTGGNLVATGSISISDADQNQSSFQTTVTGTAGNLGSLTLQSNGSYSYSVANSAVQYLGASDTKVDTFTVTAADGTTKQVSFTIHGQDEAQTDTTPPTVTLTATPDHAPANSVITVTLQFSETVTGFTQSDLQVTAGTLVANSFHQVDGDTYTVQYTRTANGNNPMTVTLNGAYTDLALNAGTGGSVEVRRDAPAGVAGESMNLALHAPEGAFVTVHIAELPDGWAVDGAIQQADGSWIVQTADVGSLGVTTPSDYAGAEVLDMTLSWTNADGTNSTVVVANNVEAYAAGTPIFAWSGDDTLTGSAAADEFVFSQPIGNDTVYNFDAAADQIDLIGYGVASFADVQSHLSDDGAGNVVLTLADGQSITLEGVSASSLTAANFLFDATPTVTNSGTMTIGDGALMPLSGTINNSGTINLASTGATTVLELIQNGITLQGGGHVVLSDSPGNEIVGSLATVSFTNVDNVISGAGNVGGGSLSLINGGTINADGTNALVIDTGSNVVVNTGTLESSGSGGLQVLGSLDNDGLVIAHAGSITVGGDVSGSGAFQIDGSALVEFGGYAGNSIVLDASATGVIVFDHASEFSGSISGLNFDDSLDLRDVQFGSSTTVNYADDGTGGGILTISDGSQSVQLHLLGHYQNSDFVLGSDGMGGSMISNGLFG